MSAAKHTPGPWTIQRYVVDRLGNEVSSFARGNLTERMRIVADPAPMIVADMVAGGGADARLIAAAPDLLEEHRRSLEVFEQLKRWLDDTGLRTHFELDASIKATRAVIAKAGGK